MPADRVPGPSCSGLELRHDDGVIRGAFVPARFHVDRTTAALRRQRGTAQYVIDPQAMIAAETRGTIIPPAETFFRLLELTENIHQTAPDQAPEGGALLVAE